MKGWGAVQPDRVAPAAPAASAKRTAAIALVIGPGQVVRAATVAILAAPVDCRPAGRIVAFLATPAKAAVQDKRRTGRPGFPLRGNDDPLDGLTPRARRPRPRRAARQPQSPTQ